MQYTPMTTIVTIDIPYVTGMSYAHPFLEENSKPKLWARYAPLLARYCVRAIVSECPTELVADSWHNLIEIVPLVGDVTLIGALHELGHCVTRGPISDALVIKAARMSDDPNVSKRAEYPSEKRAWEWALAQVSDIKLSNNAIMFMKFCLATYDAYDISANEKGMIANMLLLNELKAANLVKLETEK